MAMSLAKHNHHKKTPEKSALIGSQEGISADAFADAAVQARIQADSDVEAMKANHQSVNSSTHNKAWKKHFQESKFYKNYAQHNKSQSECKGECKKNKKALNSLKFDFMRLQDKYEALEAKAVENQQKYQTL